MRQMKINIAAGLDSAIKAEALQDGGDAVVDIVHGFCAKVYSSLIPPSQWTTSVIFPIPKKGDLSLMTNYRRISLWSITAKVYAKILFNRITDHVDPILRSWISSWQNLRSANPHPQKDHEGFSRLSSPSYRHGYRF